jgi:DNA-binding cell septation regulator SpoVG
MNNQTTITEIQIIPVKPKDGLVGFASFVIDEKYYVGSVAIFTRRDGFGYRLVYPTKKVALKNINLFHPINEEAGQTIEEKINRKFSELFHESENSENN